MTKLDDRFRGMFWGLVVGDCLGSPVQFTPKDAHVQVTGMLPCAFFNTPPGYWTDDSSLAFCIAESYVRCRGYDLADIGRNFVRWHDQGFWSSLPYAFDIGEATSLAIRSIRERGRLVNGVESSQGNGSIMRLAPAFILNYGCKDNRILFEISDLTHNSSFVRKIVSQMSEILCSHCQGVRTSARSVYRSRAEVNNSGWAYSTLQAALWAFENNRDFAAGMLAAVNLGGDADSIAAVYGQIAGAYYGYEAIPRQWLKEIKDQATIEQLIEDFLRVWRTLNPSGASRRA